MHKSNLRIWKMKETTTIINTLVYNSSKQEAIQAMFPLVAPLDASTAEPKDLGNELRNSSIVLQVGVGPQR